PSGEGSDPSKPTPGNETGGGSKPNEENIGL
ncbi:MAG: DNA-binding protein, partial [Porphyromonas sp.]|nr:DNA-binding protein [Porphyromonas sp.]